MLKISKYAKWLNISENVYAVFNNILMQVIFVDECKLADIKKFNVDVNE